MKFTLAEIVAGALIVPIFGVCLLVLAPVFFFASLVPRPQNRRRNSAARAVVQAGGLQ